MILGDTANEKRWVIIATEWGGDALHGSFIPPENRPTIFQSSREVAEEELLRLERKHHKCFALFEAVAFARQTETDPAVYIVEPITK